MIDFRVLGPLVVQVDGRPVQLGPSLRTLTLCLLLHRQPVPARRLAELMWDDERPAGWPATVRSHVCHLRRAISAPRQQAALGDVLVSVRVGAETCYALRIVPEIVDAARFERLLNAGRGELDAARPADAAILLREALAMWRGQPLADVAGRAFAAAEILRLEGLYRATLTARIEADAVLGRHREVIGELEAMLARWPTDDALRRLLVRCLCRAERPGDAALVCRAGIEVALEQGLDLTSLQALQREVLLPLELPRSCNSASTPG